MKDNDERICRICNESKPADEFLSVSGDRLVTACEDCRKRIANQPANRKRWVDETFRDLELTGRDY